MSSPLRVFGNVLIFGYLVVGIPLVWLAFLLVVGAETAQGRLFGGACLLMFPTPVLVWMSRYVTSSRPFWVATLACAAAAGCCFIGCAFLSASGRSAEGENLQSVHLGSSRFRRLSIANLVPEIDQLKLGSYLFPQIDPFIDREQGDRIRELFLRIYRESRHTDAFIDVGSSLGTVYEDLFLAKRTVGHLYTYIPETGQEGPLPVILFLHGSLGNFKGYLWVWKAFADEHGVAIVAPSFGIGNWYLEGGMDAVEAALEVCQDHPELDADRIVLAGLSNGGTGVSRAASLKPEAFRGLMFLSPVIEREVVGNMSFADSWSDRPVLVITGAMDRRIPLTYVEEAVTDMTDRGIRVTSNVFPSEDHFLFFSIPDQVMDEVAAWWGTL